MSNREDSESDEEVHTTGTELILSNSSLRSLYQIGFNSRNLTKTLSQSIKITEISSSLINYANDNKISIRSFGPLLLGLVRIYDKQMKVVLEDALSLFSTKIIQNTDAIAAGKKLSGKKERPEKNLAQKPELASNILSLSPMQDSVFTMMNNFNSNTKNSIMTPTKANYDLLTVESKEMLRKSIRKSEGSNILNLQSQSKAKSEKEDVNMISAEIGDNEKENINSFFHYVNNANGENQDMTLINDSINNNFFDFDAEMNLPSEKKKVNLSSLSFKDVDSALKPKRNKEKSYIKKNTKLEYDEYIRLSLDKSSLKRGESDHLLEMNKKLIINEKPVQEIETFKDELKYEYLFPNAFADKEADNLRNFNSIFTSEKKKIPAADYQSESKYLLDDLSKLTLEKEDFEGGLGFEEKLNEIEEQKHEESFEDNPPPNLNDIEMDDEVNNNLEEEKDSEGNEFREEMSRLDQTLENIEGKKDVIALAELIIKKIAKKKKATFPISRVIKEGRIKPEDNESKARMFYNLLILSQKGDISMSQEEVFENSAISIQYK